MKTERNILIAFLLNLAFSIFECFGGIITGSTAILSDALHDFGDAIGIGIAYFLEKKSKNNNGKSSLHSSIILSSLLLFSSVLVICNAIQRIYSPVTIHYDRMIIFAVVGVIVNLGAAYFTHGGESLNQKAVNLHMLEDVLGWAVVLAGAIIMRFTDFPLIDPVLSIGVALFILIHACKNLKESIRLLKNGNPPLPPSHHCKHHH